MSVHHREIRVSTRGDGDIHDLTEKVGALIDESEVSDGMVLVFVPGSTASITTIEYEPGLLQDFPAAMERIAPRDLDYAHDRKWHDGNGRARHLDHHQSDGGFPTPSPWVPVETPEAPGSTRASPASP